MFKKGDTIKFSDKEELICVMNKLEKEGYITDFLFEKDGEKGLWLEITKGKNK